MNKCKRVRFRIVGGKGIEAFACRMHEGQLMFMAINAVTLQETHRADQKCSRNFKNFEDFQENRSAMSYWKELKKP